MWRVLVTGLLLCALSSSALAQTGTAQTKSSLNTEQDTNFADNTSNAITPLLLRQTVADMIASWQQAPKVNPQVATTYTVVVDDYGKLITLSNAAAIAVTVPQATATFATFNVFFCNQGAGTATLTPTASTVNGGATYTLLRNQCSWLVSDGTNYQAMTLGPNKLSGGVTAVTHQAFTTGTNATYTTPAGVTWIEVTLVGGGGAGGQGSSVGNAGGNGGATCWNTSGTACTSPVYQAGFGTGGSGGAGTFAGGVGGAVSGSGTCDWGVSGGGGGGGIAAVSGTTNSSGGVGGNSSLGGGGPTTLSAAGGNAAANSGSGGGGGGATSASTQMSGSGGGAGATCRVVISAPAATYVYTVGAGGTLGASGVNGGTGGAGIIVVYEHYGQ